MAERCPEPKDDCRYAGTSQCFLSDHHEYWPSPQYTSVIDEVFRELPEHITPLPRCDHDELHATQNPPEKPDLATMMDVIENRGEKPAKNIRRLIRHLRKIDNIPSDDMPPGPVEVATQLDIGCTALELQFAPSQIVIPQEIAE